MDDLHSSETGTHRAALNPDILDNVLENFYESPTTDRRSLMAAIRVHSTWVEPAARWLWRDIPDVKCVFELMAPLELVHYIWYFTLGSSSVTANLPPHLQERTPYFDPDRLRNYTRHIHTIGYAKQPRPRTGQFAFAQQTFVYLSSIASSGPPLFPALKSLCWTSHLNQPSGNQLRVVASPTVSPNLETLWFRTCWQEIDLPVLAAIPNLNLTSFDFSLAQEDFTATNGSIASMTAALVSNQKRLARFSLSAGNVTTADPQNASQTIPEAFTRTPSSNSALRGMPWAGPYTFQCTIVPFLQCEGLEEFRLIGVFHKSLTEADVIQMGSAWSKLDTLVLHDGGWGTPSGFQGRHPILYASLLPTIAHAFPQLTFLSITLWLDVPVSPQLPRHRFRALQRLDFGGSSIPKWQIMDAASFLVSICPVGTDIGATGTGWKRWARVAKRVQEIQEERSQSRVN